MITEQWEYEYEVIERGVRDSWWIQGDDKRDAQIKAKKPGGTGRIRNREVRYSPWHITTM
jgi:hypothetical protein